MTNDLISRSALLEAMRSVIDDSTCPMHIAAEIDQIIDFAPAVDAVEVVRCKECKHCICLSRRYRGDIACSKLHTDNIYPDFYCGCGERRVDDGK